MTIYNVFLRGRSNARGPAVGECVWIGEAKSRAHAVELAVEAGRGPYPGQYLEAKPSSACTAEEQRAAFEAAQIETCPECGARVARCDFSAHWNAHRAQEWE